MKQSIKNKINSIKALAKNNVQSTPKIESISSNHNDSLSTAIRNKKEADIFKKELSNAFKLAKG